MIVTSDADSEESFAARLQRIDEQLAGEQLAGEQSADSEFAEAGAADEDLDHQIEQAREVLKLLNRVRVPDEVTKRESAAGDTDRNDELNHAGLTRDDQPSLADIPSVGFRIGDYLVEEEIARGGMGIVFRALDLNLNRAVALKVLLAGPFARNEDRIRFRGEAEAAARLDHPGIVPVYEVGDRDGMLYFTMGLIQGSSLSQRVRQSPLDPIQAATIAMQIADAAQYAHGKGVVHRDLKPANVLVDQNERVRVTDFGLARQTDGGSDLTQTGQVVGTPEYMAPEQAAGNASDAGPSADIYSIGATLYCMLTGQPPFRSSSSVETLRKVIEQEPISVRQFNRLIPADLETICLRCLEKQPDKRYPTAASLAEDLGRYLAGEPIEARRPRLPERVLRWSRRHPLAASLVGVLMLLAIIGPIIATSQMRLAKDAQSARDSMARTLYISDMNLAMRDWDEANLGRCGDLLKRHLPAQGQVDQRGFEWYYLWRNWQQSQSVSVVFEDQQLETIAVSRDEKVLAVGCFDGRLILWDLPGGRIIRQWQAHPYRTYRLEFSKDGKTLASASIDNEVTLWDVATGARLRQFSGSRAVALSPIDNSFAYRTQGRQINLHPSIDDQPVVISDADSQYVETIAYSPDGLQIASAGWDGQVELWDAKTGESLRTMAGGHPTIWSLAWSSANSLLAGGDVNGVIRIWEMETGELRAAFTGHTETINALAFSPDGNLLVSAGDDNTIAIRSLVTGQLKQKLKIHSAEVRSVVFVDQGKSLLTASSDGTVKRWSLDSELGESLLEHPALVNSIAFYPDGKRIATACYDGKIRRWNVADGTLEHELVAHDDNVWRVKVVDVGGRTLMFTSGQDSSLRIWDAETSELIQEFDAKPNALDPLSFAVSPDQSLLAYPDSSNGMVVWDLANNRRVVSLSTGKFDDLHFASDGRTLLACSGTLMFLWDAKTGRQLREWPGGSRVITRLGYSPDGQTFAAVTHDRLVKIWDTRELLDFQSSSPQPQKILTGSAGILSSLAYTHNGSILASGGDDQVIRLWDAETGQQRAVLLGHAGSVVDLAFSPDDQVLASASLDHTVRLWRGDRTDLQK